MEIPKGYKIFGKVLQAISHSWAAAYATRLFFTPIRFAMPEREKHMDKESRQKLISIPAIGKKINVYEYGDAPRKILLVHGWSGRGTQLVTLADTLLAKGYSVVSFDAPAHGKSSGNKTYMAEFIACIIEIDKQLGSFYGIIGHSLGAMSSINALAMGMSSSFLICIGSGDIIEDIIYDFTDKLELKKEVGRKVHGILNEKLGSSVNRYSASMAIRKLQIPILIIHDEDDTDVPVSAAHNIHKNAPNSELYITQGLGHRRVMADAKVMERIQSFVENKTNKIV
ncbi:MAG: alpha/beta hydrolase [Capnocytophaga sp.]|nr:alpha/beta hydrolase [Capnocytophaga sp.]